MHCFRLVHIHLHIALEFIHNIFDIRDHSCPKASNKGIFSRGYGKGQVTKKQRANSHSSINPTKGTARTLVRAECGVRSERKHASPLSPL
jgi:hypothetical protein